MQEFTTGWFDTEQAHLRAKCDARVARTFNDIRIDWNIQMKFDTSGYTIETAKYIDVIVNSNPNIGTGTQRVKDRDETWTGTAEHSIGGTFTFTDANAGTGVLTFRGVSNLVPPEVFANTQLNYNYEEYDEEAEQDTIMPFASVFTTEEYLENHKALLPRNNIYNE